MVLQVLNSSGQAYSSVPTSQSKTPLLFGKYYTLQSQDPP